MLIAWASGAQTQGGALVATVNLPKRNTSRRTRAHLAASLYVVLVSALFLLPFVVSERAQQNDVFLTNLFGGVAFFVVGSLWLSFSVLTLGAWRWIPFALIAATFTGVLLAMWARRYSGTDTLVPSVLLMAGALVLACTVLAALLRSWAAWWRAVALALLGLIVAGAVYYAIGGRYLAFGERTTSLPPYLTTTVVGVSVAIGLAVFVLATIGGERPRSAEPSR